MARSIGLAVFVAAVALSAPRRPIAGPDGWSRAHWGMAPDEVRGEFAEAYTEDRSVVVENVLLGSISFGEAGRHRHPITATARFTFDRVMGLEAVRLMLNDPTDEQFQALGAALRQLYGDPDFSTETSARWDFVHSVVTLAREDSGDRFPSAVWLQYQRARYPI